jgi:hypothetical protein
MLHGRVSSVLLAKCFREDALLVEEPVRVRVMSEGSTNAREIDYQPCIYVHTVSTECVGEYYILQIKVCDCSFMFTTFWRGWRNKSFFCLQ